MHAGMKDQYIAVAKPSGGGGGGGGGMNVISSKTLVLRYCSPL